MTHTFIPPDTADLIKETAKLEEVVPDYIQLRRSGVSLVGDCPKCGGKKKLNVSPKKKIWKCFACDIGGNNAVSFLMKTQDQEYLEALNTLADRYRISIEREKPKKKKAARKIKFREQQLRQSGIPVKAQKYWLSQGSGTKYELDRYQAATVDGFWNVKPGDDMVLHYLDLDGQPVMYKNKKGKARALVRVRWANPSLHRDKNGKAVKYRQPSGSGSHLWLPQYILKAYRTFEAIKTLFICEGEKKADKLCLHGMPAVGVMGINNFAAAGEMPYQFELLIKRCGVQQVVFILDSDWQELSLKDPSKPVDSRPNTFYKAVLRFRDYFHAYHTSGIELDIFFAHGRDAVHKGIDDLLVHDKRLKKKEELLAGDFKKAMSDREGKGEFVNAHNITQTSSYKLKEFWHLHSRPAFLQKHKEQLKELREFRFGQMKWRWNKATAEFEMADRIRPYEQYWNKVYDGEGKDGKEKWKYSFNYTNVLEFLKNRGYGLFETGPETYRFIRVEDRVVEEISPHRVQRYVIDFTRELDERPVLEMLLRGGKQYLGPDKLSNMHYFSPEFNRSDGDTMYLYFRNVYWKITKEEIIERPLKELPRHIWKDKLVDFGAKYLGSPLMSLERKKDDWVMEPSEEGKRCDMANFYLRTSMYHWRKLFHLATDGEGNRYWADRDEPERPTADDLKIMRANMAAKMVSAGYLLHEHTDWGCMKAIICMDGLESEVGRSQGGTGKGVYCSQFEKLVPVHWVNGKRKNLEEDKHLYAGVDERTQVIYFEDVRVNFDFEQLFPGITRGTWVERKGIDGHKEAPKKHLIDTNHGLTGEGNSFARRQYLLSFSDYYNSHRRVSDDFGYQLFEDWDDRQWNLFYNWMATCCQAYLQHRLDYSIPTDILEKRNLRQRIGENFIDWASLMFDGKEGPMLNHKVEKVWACSHYLEQYPQDKRYVTPKRFKAKLIKYAKYAGLEFNPPVDGLTSDGRIKSSGKEYLLLANESFDPVRCRMISSNANLSQKLPI